MRGQEQDVQVERGERRRSRNDSGITYRHIHPNGRIIGKPGRRQVQSSEKLASKALGRPAQVVVLRDLAGDQAETPQWETDKASSLQSAAKGLGLNRHELERALRGEDVPVEQQEVNESIDAMRPEETAISDAKMHALKEELIGGFNIKQLVGYLLKSVGKQHGGADGSRQGHQAIRVSPWRPGQTPLNHRLNLSGIRKGDTGKSKADIVNQILRFGWHLITETERRQVGEAELHVKQWQIKYLFDTSHKGRSMLDTLLDSPLLSRSCLIQAHRPNSTIRITARQGDANEAIERLKRDLENVDHDTMTLQVFESLLRPGQKLAELFAPEDLAYVAERTGTLLEEEGGAMHIYSGVDERRKSMHAKRLLLGLLTLPAPIGRLQLGDTVDAIQRAELQRLAGKVQKVPVAVFGAPPQVLSKQWHRNTVPTATHGYKHGTNKDASAADYITSDDELHTLAGVVSRKLEQPYHVGSEGLDSDIWTLSQDTEWIASIGTLLHHSSPKDNTQSIPKLRKKGVKHKPAKGGPDQHFSAQTTNFLFLFSHFAPASVTKPTASSLRVHLLPCPFERKKVEVLEHLPRIIVDLDLSSSSPSPPKVTAILHEQHFTLPLPTRPSDIRFVRTRSMTAEATSLGQRSGIQKFLSRLRKDLTEDSGYLPADMNIEVPLPGCMMKKIVKEGEEGKDRRQTYLVLGYEFMRTADFVPVREGKRVDAGVVEAWKEGLVVRWEEVDGGSSGGRRTEIKVVRMGNEMGHEQKAGKHSDHGTIDPGSRQSLADDAESKGAIDGALAKSEPSQTSNTSGERQLVDDGKAVATKPRPLQQGKALKEQQLVNAAFAMVRLMSQGARE